ncbi:MAG: hypothetical protein ACP5C4_03025 [Methanomicrobiales archaeon]
METTGPGRGHDILVLIIEIVIGAIIVTGGLIAIIKLIQVI